MMFVRMHACAWWNLYTKGHFASYRQGFLVRQDWHRKKGALHVAITATSERRAMIIWDNEPDSSSFPRYNAKIQTKVFINGALIHRQSGVTGPNETHPEIGNL